MAMGGSCGLRKWGLNNLENAAKLRSTVASGFSVASVRTAPIGVSLLSVMKELVFQSHSIAPDP